MRVLSVAFLVLLCGLDASRFCWALSDPTLGSLTVLRDEFTLQNAAEGRSLLQVAVPPVPPGAGIYLPVEWLEAQYQLKAKKPYFKDNAHTGFYPTPMGTVIDTEDILCGPESGCFCIGWEADLGTKLEKEVLTAFKWIVFAICVASLIFFGYEFIVATCGWEETYVCIIELVHVCFSIWHMTDSPAMLYLSTGDYVLWLRYAEWLLSCPVILIHLSNLTGMANDYNKRTMALLVSDVGCIVWGTTAALGQGPVKISFFFLGLTFGMYTFYAAAKIYIEAYHTVPKGVCRQLVKFQAYDYFLTWSLFPVLFILGPEGFGHISQYASGIAHEILDLFSKNLWGILGHLIRVKIHHHILEHGHITLKTKMVVGGEEVEVETYVDQEEAADPENEDAIVDKGTAELANRHSFVVMKERMVKNGVEVRASLGAHDMGNNRMAGANAVQPGRVVLCVPDQSLAVFFQEQFSLMPAPIELHPALTPEACLQLVQQGMTVGGPMYVDYVLVHPEYLRDRSPAGLLSNLKMMNMRVCAFGWVHQGPHRELIEACGPALDGYVEGPSFQAGFDPQQLMMLTARMQAQKVQMAMGGMAMGGMAMNGNMGGHQGNMAGNMNSMNGHMGGMNGHMGSMNGDMGMNGSMHQGMEMTGSEMKTSVEEGDTAVKVGWGGSSSATCAANLVASKAQRAYSVGLHLFFCCLSGVLGCNLSPAPLLLRATSSFATCAADLVASSAQRPYFVGFLLFLCGLSEALRCDLSPAPILLHASSSLAT
eukprot:gene24783-10424_t